VEPWGQEEARQWWAAVARRDQAATSGRDV